MPSSGRKSANLSSASGRSSWIVFLPERAAGTRNKGSAQPGQKGEEGSREATGPQTRHSNLSIAFLLNRNPIDYKPKRAAAPFPSWVRPF